MRNPKEDQSLTRLENVGIKLDRRQEGWPIDFGTFAVVDWEYGEFVAKLCVEAREIFIEKAPALNYCSPLRSITFFPFLTTAPIALKRPLAIGYRRKEIGVAVKANLNLPMWSVNTARARRTAFFRALTEGIAEIKSDWLWTQDKSALVSLFRSSKR